LEDVNDPSRFDDPVQTQGVSFFYEKIPMRVLFIILTVSCTFLFSQNLAGTWIILQQYHNGVLVSSQPYLRYDFIPPHSWNIRMRSNFDGEFSDYEDGGTYTIKDGKIGLSYWNEEDISWGEFYIQGDSLLVIETFWQEETVKLIFRRESQLPEL